MNGLILKYSKKIELTENNKTILPEIQRKRQSTTIQTLLFDKKKFNRAQAVKWAKDHGFKSNKVDETENKWRLRQRNPKEFKPDSFRTINLDKGIDAVIGKLKKQEKKQQNNNYKYLIEIYNDIPIYINKRLKNEEIITCQN